VVVWTGSGMQRYLLLQWPHRKGHFDQIDRAT